VSPRRPPPEEHLAVRREILDEGGVAQALARMARQILDRNGGAADLVLVGVRTSGVPLAERLQALLADQGGGDQVPLGAVDITLYRDDVFYGLPRPEVGPTELHEPIEDRVVVLVDDVLYTGRTVRAALDELMEFGRPRAVELAVLVDRGHRELPIQPDFVGVRVETSRDESVRVMLRETGDPCDRVVVRVRQGGG
jgi:pyrimidine operon attenuation protein/uracil phosphoribosyltransferase